MTETITRSAWMKKHQGAGLTIRMALGRPEVAAMTAAELAKAMVEEANAPAAYVALTLRDVADFRSQRGDTDTAEQERLREAARLIGGGALPPSRMTRLRRKLEAHVAPYEPKPLPVCDPLTGKPLRP